MTIAIVENQNLVDFALQKYGVAESIIQLCNDNGISLSDDLVSGAQVLIDETIVYKTTGAITGPAAAAINRKRLVNEYESAVDIALKECNSVEALIDVLIGNGIAPDDDLTAGEQLLIKPEWKRKRLPAPAMIIPSKKKVMNEYDNIVDAALAIYGNAESLVGICSLNALLVDEEINPGQLLIDNTQEYKTTGAILGPLKSTLKTTEMVIEHQNLIVSDNDGVTTQRKLRERRSSRANCHRLVSIKLIVQNCSEICENITLVGRDRHSDRNCRFGRVTASQRNVHRSQPRRGDCQRP